jgi:hypothetical protein
MIGPGFGVWRISPARPGHPARGECFLDAVDGVVQ